MTGFIPWLEHITTRQSKARAELRRSLAFTPGTYIPAFPYVEPFLQGTPSPWHRQAVYLTAGLWALQAQPAQRAPTLSFAKACAAHHNLSGSASIEQRFLTVLDADPEQLPHRLRQLIGILKPYPLNWDILLHGLLHWTDAERPTQQIWAREFYQQQTTTERPASPVTTKETSVS